MRISLLLLSFLTLSPLFVHAPVQQRVEITQPSHADEKVLDSMTSHIQAIRLNVNNKDNKTGELLNTIDELIKSNNYLRMIMSGYMPLPLSTRGQAG